MGNQEKEISIRDELENQGVPTFITRPDKTDKILWTFFILITVFNFSLVPLRIWFMNNPEWYSAIIGGYTSSIILGAHKDISYFYVFLSIIGACKFLPFYYFMGKYWGRDFIDYATQSMPKLNKRLLHYIDDEKKKVKRCGFILIPLSYIPGARIGKAITIPILVLANTSFLVIFVLNAISVVVINSGFYYLGTLFGKQVIEVIDVFNKYSGFIIFGLIFYTIFVSFYKNKKNSNINDDLNDDIDKTRR